MGNCRTPYAKNQASILGNVCSICEVTDIIIRYTRISHAGGGIAILTAPSDGGGAAKAGARFRIHDIVLDDISRKYVGRGRLFELGNSWPSNPLHTVNIHQSDASFSEMVWEKRGSMLSHKYARIERERRFLVDQFPRTTPSKLQLCAYPRMIDVPGDELSDHHDKT